MLYRFSSQQWSICCCSGVRNLWYTASEHLRALYKYH
jgi:hypothetical protein